MYIIKLLALILLVFSCNKSEEYVYKDNPRVQPRSDKTYSLSISDLEVDILWVVDNSGSMGDIQRNIESNASLFMNEFSKSNLIEWRMGLISTDDSQLPFLGFDTVPFDFNSPDPVITFQNAIDRLGTNGSASEFVFKNINNLFNSHPNFFRENAHLAIIMVSDEEEQSAGSSWNPIPRYKPFAFLNSMKARMKANRILRFYGALQTSDLEDCTSGMFNYKGSAYETVINETSGIIVSACSSQFGKQLAKIGEDIVNFGEAPVVNLNELPVVETIRVFFENVEIPGGPKELGGKWYYSERDKAIYFYDADFIPSGIPNPRLKITFDIDDGYNRDIIE